MTEVEIKKLEKANNAIIHDGRVIFEDLTLADLGNIQYALAFVVDKLERRSHSYLDGYKKTLKKIDNILLQY